MTVRTIAFITDVHRPTGATGYGGSTYAHGLLERLERRGIDHVVITRDGSVPGDDDRVIRIGRPYDDRDGAGKLAFSIALTRARDRLAAAQIVHSTSAASLPFLGLERHRGRPTLFDCRTGFVRTAPALAAFQLALLAVMPPTCVSFCEPVSVADHRRILRRAAATIPVPVDALPRGMPDPMFTIAYAGELRREKGVGDLLAAMDRAWSDGLDTRLDLVGDGPLAAAARDLALRWPDKATVHGHVTFDRAREIVSHASLLVHPSHWEGMSRSVLEALAMGVPALVTPVGGLRVLAERGLVDAVPRGRPELLAAAIQRARRDPDRLVELGARGRRYVQDEHSWDLVVAAVVAIYDRIAGAARA